MIKRKGFSQKVREEVFRKYDGHCAYCGKVLTTDDFDFNEVTVSEVEALVAGDGSGRVQR